MDASIADLGGFCELMGLNKVRQYLVSRRLNEIRDWSQYKLDPEGQAIQAELEERLKVRFNYFFDIFSHI